jgi:hypothetical protein
MHSVSFCMPAWEPVGSEPLDYEISIQQLQPGSRLPFPSPPIYVRYSETNDTGSNDSGRK